jgi:hypothetical protein
LSMKETAGASLKGTEIPEAPTVGGIKPAQA